MYAGSFDLLTIGHLWMIERGSELFDHLIVAVGDNPDKITQFTPHERVRMLQESTAHVNNVRIGLFSKMYLYEYALQERAEFILRGIRNSDDYEKEKGMRNLNGDFAPTVMTSFLMPPRELCEVSSSFVKGLIGPHGWEKKVAEYVPQPVYQVLTSG